MMNKLSNTLRINFIKLQAKGLFKPIDFNSIQKEKMDIQ